MKTAFGAEVTYGDHRQNRQEKKPHCIMSIITALKKQLASLDEQIEDNKAQVSLLLENERRLKQEKRETEQQLERAYSDRMQNLVAGGDGNGHGKERGNTSRKSSSSQTVTSSLSASSSMSSSTSSRWSQHHRYPWTDDVMHILNTVFKHPSFRNKQQVLAYAHSYAPTYLSTYMHTYTYMFAYA